MAKSRRLRLDPEDRVIGIRSRDKRDLFAGCNEPGRPWFQRDAHEFERVYCRLCKNADCLRAKGAINPWVTRMQEQVDYLLNSPVFSDMGSPEHRALADMAFEDIRAKAERLEIARARQDWEIPEGPTDGYDRVAEPSTTEGFDDAVRALAKAKGKAEPELPTGVSEEQPPHFSPAAAPEYEYETQYPSSDGKRTYHVALTKEGTWSCGCKGFQNVRKCKHLKVVRAWYEEELRKARETEAQEAPAETPPPSSVRDPRVPEETPRNTPMPSGGVMVGGGAAPEPPPRRRPPAPQRQRDAWDLPDERIVQPGATVTVKRGKK